MKYSAKIFLLTSIFASFLFPTLALAGLTDQVDMSSLTPVINIKIGQNEIKFNTIRCNGDTCQVDWLAKYISVIYQYGIGIAAILAVVMIMVGGFIWLLSAGSPDKVGKAKEFITAAFTGLFLALFSFIILNAINPRLTQIEPLSYNQPKEDFAGSHGNVSQSSSATARSKPELGSITSDNAINYLDQDGNPVVPAINPGVNFTAEQIKWFNDYGKEYGVDPELLMAICAAESSGSSGAVSPAGAYGLMQFLPSTATGVASNISSLSKIPELADGQITGQELVNNPQLSVELAAAFISSNSSGLTIDDTIAGYNGGYGTKPGSALSPSRDCPGTNAYQCTINPGGLVETQNYVYNVLSYYGYYNH